MELFLATKTGTPIIGQIASVMGWIMDGIYKMLDGLFGIQNIGLCIIIFSILIFALYDTAADQAAEILQVKCDHAA